METALLRTPGDHHSQGHLAGRHESLVFSTLKRTWLEGVGGKTLQEPREKRERGMEKYGVARKGEGARFLMLETGAAAELPSHVAASRSNSPGPYVGGWT